MWEGDTILQNLLSMLALPTHSLFLNDLILSHSHTYNSQALSVQEVWPGLAVSNTEDKGTVESPSWEIFKSHLDMLLCNLP